MGAKTGRDGIHGATMASAEFADDSAAKRPTVQVGDPFTEKLLLEACLELMSPAMHDVLVGIQDMGAASRRGPRPRPRRGAAARAGDDALRADAVGVAGADAARRAGGARAGG